MQKITSKVYLLTLAYEVHRIAAGVNPRPQGHFGGNPPGIFEVQPGATITLEPDGMLASNHRNAPGYRVLIYYTVVAWDSEQTELYTREVERTQRLIQGGVAVGGSIQAADPCPASDRERLGGDPTEICGPLFGGMQMFEFRMSFDQEVERLYLAAGEMGGEASGGAFDYEHIQTPHLERRGFRTIDWQIASFLDGGSASTIYRRRFRGTLFAGRSLRLRGRRPSVHQLSPGRNRPSQRSE